MMRLIAFTSISHFGFIVLGIFALTSVGGAGSTLYMVNHGFSTAGLFLLAGFLVSRRGSRRIPDYGGWQRVTPVLAGTFLVVGLSSLALPGLSSFVSEFLVLQGTFMRYRWAAVIAAIGIVLAALYILLMYQRVMTGPKPAFAEGEAPRDLSLREKLVVAPIIASFVLLGFYPEAGARPRQPGRGPDAAVRRRHRPRAGQRPRECPVNRVPGRRRRVPGRRCRCSSSPAGRSSGCSSRRSRRAGSGTRVQVWLTTGVLVLALVALLVWSWDEQTVTLGGSVAIDGVALFLQGSLLVLVGDLGPHHGRALRWGRRRRLHPDGRLDAGLGPGGRRDPRRVRDLRGLPAHPVRGPRHDGLRQRQRPHHDVRRARGPLAAALRHDRPVPPPPPAVAGGRAEVLPPRGLLERVLPLRRRAPLRLRRLERPQDHRVGDLHRLRRPRGAAAARASSSPSSACSSRSARCRSTRGPPTPTRAPPPRSPASWRRAPSSRRSAPSCASPTSASAPTAGTGRSASRRSRR